MTKFEKVIESCKKQMKAQNIAVDEDLLTKIAKSLSPSIYNRDSALVAAAQKSELETIKKNFLVKKLGCEDGPELDKTIEKAVTKIGKSNRAKLRVVFYYIMVKDLGKEAIYK